MICADALPRLALSIRQPWAWAILHAGKDVENRSRSALRWAKPDSIAIHAAKGMTRDEYEDAAAFMLTLCVECPPPAELVRGAIIGTALHIATTTDSASPWFFGPAGLELSHQTPLAAPIPARGALGLFDWRTLNSDNAATEPDPAKPWMKAYPDQPVKLARKAAASAQLRDLFGGGND